MYIFLAVVLLLCVFGVGQYCCGLGKNKSNKTTSQKRVRFIEMETTLLGVGASLQVRDYGRYTIKQCSEASKDCQLTLYDEDDTMIHQITIKEQETFLVTRGDVLKLENDDKGDMNSTLLLCFECSEMDEESE